MKILGITGGVGAGKSTVLNYLKRVHGAHVLEADRIGHLLMEPNGLCYDPVIALFGKQIIKNDKTIDRSMVSDVVFGNEEFRTKLDEIIHPAVKAYIKKEINTAKENGEKLFVVEAALFFEDHYDEFCDQVWYVYVDEQIRIERLISDRGYSRKKAESIISRQADEHFFRMHTDKEICNNTSLEETYRQIEEGLRKL